MRADLAFFIDSWDRFNCIFIIKFYSIGLNVKESKQKSDNKWRATLTIRIAADEKAVISE